MLLGGPRRRWGGSTKLDLQETAGRASRGVILLRIAVSGGFCVPYCGELLDELRNSASQE